MNRFPLIPLIVLVGCLQLAPALRAQDTAARTARIEGRVVDAGTGQPLGGAHIYLSGTRIGTAAGADGRYRLRRIPPGGHRVVVSRIGYGTILADLVIGPGEQQTMDFELEPVVYSLPEVYVGNFDREWEKNLERFTRHFIGASAWADSVQILNPRVLRFETTWWGKITAEALAPLQVVNRALGYRITYHLAEFSHAGSRTRWDGEPLFTEMTPADPAQAAYWKRNREQAFRGSLRHFLLALLADRVRTEGFRLYQISEGVYGFSTSSRDRITGRSLLQPADRPWLQHLNFDGLLEVIYSRETENQRYIRWLRGNRRTAGRAQTSWLELNERPVTVDADGEIVQPYGVTQSGYFAFSRLAEATPRQYRPEGWSVDGE